MSTIIGRPMSRVDGALKVTGQARYAAEHSAPGLLYALAVQATIARGRLVALDTTAAEAFPGVVKVYTHENRPRLARFDRRWKDEVAPAGRPFRPLQGPEILFDGQPVALVVAETWEAARDAAALIWADYEEEAPLTDLALAESEAREPPENGAPKPRGNPDQAFAEAPVTVACEYRLGGEHHQPMEMFAATVIHEAGQPLVVHDKTQGSQNVHDHLCGVFGLKAKDLVVRNEFVGGAFGQGLRPKHHVVLGVMAALDLKRSVRVEMTRREMFALTWRPAAIQRMRLAADTDGTLRAIRHEAVTATSRYEDYSETIVDWSGLAYRCENVDFSYRIASLDRSTSGDMRGPGAATGLVALEAAMDELAHALKMDPLALRRANYVGHDQNEGKELTSKALATCYDQGSAAFGWQGGLPPRSLREGRDLIGHGMATGVWEAMMQSAEARIRLDVSGRVRVQAAATDIGTGTTTILAQIAAEEMDVDPSAVTVEIADSRLPKTSVQGGSWTAASTGSAVLDAAAQLRKALLAAAAGMNDNPLAGADPAGLVIRAGRLVRGDDPGAGLSIGDILARAGLEELEAAGKAGPDRETKTRFTSYTHSACFVEVRVDEQLFVPRVTRVVSAVAAGRILNPKTARSQILGGVVMGLGMALHEEALIDHRTGRIMNHDLAEYHLAAHADVPDIEVIFVEEEDPRVSPIGAKGLGEIGIVGVPAAVANAIFHATGRRARHLPITIDRLRAAQVPA